MSAATSAGACRASTSPSDRSLIVHAAKTMVRMNERAGVDRRPRSARPTPPPRISAASSATSSNGTARSSASKGTYNWLDKSVTATDADEPETSASAADALIYSVSRHGHGAHHRLRHDARQGRLGGEQLVMPYATFGIAVGRDGHARAPRDHADWPARPRRPAPSCPRRSRSARVLKNQFAYGYAAGFGVDFCLMANLFCAPEYEYVQFPRLPRTERCTSTTCGSARRFKF